MFFFHRSTRSASLFHFCFKYNFYRRYFSIFMSFYVFILFPKCGPKICWVLKKKIIFNHFLQANFLPRICARLSLADFSCYNHHHDHCYNHHHHNRCDHHHHHLRYRYHLCYHCYDHHRYHNFTHFLIITIITSTNFWWNACRSCC